MCVKSLPVKRASYEVVKAVRCAVASWWVAGRDSAKTTSVLENEVYAVDMTPPLHLMLLFSMTAVEALATMMSC